MCLPKSCGGFNLPNIVIWNEAALVKQIRAIENKKDRLWIRWIHDYYVKGRNFLELKMPATCSWMLKKIMELRVSLSSKLDRAKILRDEDFSIKKSLLGYLATSWSGYLEIFGLLPSPRAKFCFWMIALGRRPTCDRLFWLGFGENQLCSLCGLINEFLDHILHTCDFVQEVRSMLFRPFDDMFFGCSIQEAINLFAHYSRRKN